MSGGRRQVEGREGGPFRADCEVVDRRREGIYLGLSVAAPEIAEQALPGQFVNVAVEAPGTVLRRPFSISQTRRHGRHAGTVEFVFDAHGPGTAWLADREARDFLDVVGPLGTPFGMPQHQVPCLLVGGGYGAAPLFFLAESLRSEGHRIDLILGAATSERVFSPIEAKRVSASVTFTTEDGSLGRRGVVTDVFDEIADKSGSGVVYACGPMPMLEAVTLHAAGAGIPCQVAVEEHMACGVGVCWTCVLPIRSKDGSVHMRRSCLDGPVFNASRIAWDRSRWAARPIAEEFTPAQAETEGVAT